MLELASKAFLTFFVVIDPVGVVPMFVALVGNRPRLEQLRIARKAILVAGGVILFFALVGGPLLERLGISLEALRIAGGILLFRIAVDMVFAHWERETKEEQDEAKERSDVSVFPLAIPLIAGPGTLASVLILAGESRRVEFGLWIVLGMAAVVLVMAYFLLQASSRLRFLLGRTGINVVTRVLGLLLAALAVQYVADGTRAFLES